MQWYSSNGAFICPDNLGCGGIPATPCAPCGTYMLASDYVCYSGPPLVSLGINTYDTLTVVLQKIEEQIALLTTSTTTTIPN